MQGFLSVFPQQNLPTIASDPFLIVVDGLTILMLAYIIVDRARHHVVGFIGAVYSITLLGFVGSFLWIWDRYFYNHVPTPEFALWALKDIGVMLGTAYLIWHNWRRRP